MSKYLRDPNLTDFLNWLNDKNNKEIAEEFYELHILPSIIELEGEDFFGTEGFDKRYG